MNFFLLLLCMLDCLIILGSICILVAEERLHLLIRRTVFNVNILTIILVFFMTHVCLGVILSLGKVRWNKVIEHHIWLDILLYSYITKHAERVGCTRLWYLYRIVDINKVWFFLLLDVSILCVKFFRFNLIGHLRYVLLKSNLLGRLCLLVVRDTLLASWDLRKLAQRQFVSSLWNDARCCNDRRNRSCFLCQCLRLWKQTGCGSWNLDFRHACFVCLCCICQHKTFCLHYRVGVRQLHKFFFNLHLLLLFPVQ